MTHLAHVHVDSSTTRYQRQHTQSDGEAELCGSYMPKYVCIYRIKDIEATSFITGATYICLLHSWRQTLICCLSRRLLLASFPICIIPCKPFAFGSVVTEMDPAVIDLELP